MAKLAGENIRNYPQLTRPESATAGIYHRAGRPPAIRLWNHSTESANLPIITDEFWECTDAAGLSLASCLRGPHANHQRFVSPNVAMVVGYDG